MFTNKKTTFFYLAGVQRRHFLRLFVLKKVFSHSTNVLFVRQINYFSIFDLNPRGGKSSLFNAMTQMGR